MKKKKKEESNIRDLWDKIKCARKKNGEKEDWKCIWRNYCWKVSKPKEGNRYLSTGSTEGPKHDKSKQTYTKIYYN